MATVRSNNPYRAWMNVMYCLAHGCLTEVNIDQKGRTYHEYVLGNGDMTVCYGKFAWSEPPPSLTEEQWQEIFALEGANDGTEVSSY